MSNQNSEMSSQTAAIVKPTPSTPEKIWPTDTHSVSMTEKVPPPALVFLQVVNPALKAGSASAFSKTGN